MNVLTHTIPFALLLAPALLPAPAAAQRVVDTDLVIRHDPDLIRLDARLVQALLQSERAVEALRAAVGADHADDVSAFARSDSQVQQQQPPGVYVGGLQIRCGEGVPRSLDERALQAAAEALRGELTRRLYDEPRQRLTEQLADAQRGFFEANQDMTKAAAERAHVEERERLNAEIDQLKAQHRDLNVEMNARQTTLRALEQQVAEARAQQQGAQLHSQQMQRQARDLSTRLAATQAEIARLQEAEHREPLRDLMQRIAQMNAELSDVETELAQSNDLVLQSNSHLQGMLEQVNSTSVDIETLRAREAAVRDEMDRVLSVAASRPERASPELDLRMRQHERAVDLAADRRERLQARIAELQPVTVELWR